MHPIAVCITLENAPFFKTELEYIFATPNLNNIEVIDYLGMYIVISEEGPELLHHAIFHQWWIFTRPYTPAMHLDYQRIVSRHTK